MFRTPSIRRRLTATAVIAIAGATAGMAPVVEAKPITALAWKNGTVDVTNGTYNFGSIAPGGAASLVTLTLENTGTTTVRKPAVTLTPTVGTEITLTANNTCATAVLKAPTLTCTVELRFQPSATGSQSATLSVTASRTAYSVTITGSGAGVQAASLRTGGNHTCAATTTGAAQCWGKNDFGQLGRASNTTVVYTPGDVTGLTSGVAAVATGGDFSCALTTAGGVKCWGKNDLGQLGNGTNTNSTSPVDVTGLTSGVTAISAAGGVACAVLSTGGAKCWGFNLLGMLGDGTTTNSNTPVDVSGLSSGVTAISTGGIHTCAVVSGGAKCWGLNASGQLGDGTTTNRTTPVDVSGLTTGVTAIAAGASGSTCAIVSGGAKCWGQNNIGQVGDGTTTGRTTPVDVSGLTSGVTAIAVAGHACAIVNGGAKCWGFNSYGQVGDGTTTNRSTPVDVSGLASGVASITVGNATAVGGGGTTCAITTGGGAKCWGVNASGQGGLGSTVSTTSTPRDVIGYSDAPAVAPQGRR